MAAAKAAAVEQYARGPTTQCNGWVWVLEMLCQAVAQSSVN